MSKIVTKIALLINHSKSAVPPYINNTNKGKVAVVPGDKELRSSINDNLGKLSEQPYEKLENEIAELKAELTELKKVN